MGAYLLVVLLKVCQLLAECLQLDLKVGSAQGQLVQDPPQAIDVRVNALVERQFILVP